MATEEAQEGAASSYTPSADQWRELLASWELSQFEKPFEENGWTDVEDWKQITEQDLIQMGLKRGHMVRFQRKLSALSSATNNDEDKAESKQNDNGGAFLYVKPGAFYKIQCGSVYLDNWGNPQQGQEVKLAAHDNQPTDKNYSNQLWRFVPTIYDDAKNLLYKIQNYNFHAFIDNWGVSQQGQVLRLASYDNPPTAANYTNQLWRIIPSARDGYYKLQNGGCFMDNWSNPKQGQQVMLASRDNKSTDSNYSNQLFRFIECPFPRKHNI